MTRRARTILGVIVVAAIVPIVSVLLFVNRTGPGSESASPTTPKVDATAVPPTAVAEAPALPTEVPVPPTLAPTPGPVRRTAQGAYVQNVDAQGRPRPSGSRIPFTVSVEPGPPQPDFRLGIFETNVGRVGPTWRAAAWMATVMGALEAGRDLSTLRVAWETTGLIDGPSVGGLMTVAFIAALRGDDFKTDVAMTGTINPDGTIGPVGGIQYKLDAAAKDGIKTFLVPMGHRTEVDESTNQSVDLIQKGQLAGVQVKEVATLGEAYEALTGTALPRAQLPTRQPELSAETYDRLRPRVLDWMADYQEAMGRFRSAAPAVQRLYATNVAEIEAIFNRAQRRLNEGAVAGAYWEIQEATNRANQMALGARAYEFRERGDFDGAINAVVQGAGVSRVGPLIDRLKAYQPTSAEEAVLAVDAWATTLWAVAVHEAVLTEAEQARLVTDREEQFDHLLNAAALQASERFIAKSADDILAFNFGRAPTTAKRVDPQALEGWAAILKRAAEANVQYFDALILEEAAAQYGVRTEVMKASFAANNLQYVTATFGASPAAQEYLDKIVGKGPALAYAQTGFAIASYVASSGLVTQYYSLGAQLDEDGQILGFRRERALAAGLDAAQDRARERIAALDQAGGNSSFPTLIYQMARAAREGDAQEKADALEQYWYSSLYARLMAFITQ